MIINKYKKDLTQALHLLFTLAEQSSLAELTGGGLRDIDLAQEILLDFINNRLETEQQQMSVNKYMTSKGYKGRN